MRHLRSALVLGAVVVSASCASILGIQEPETVPSGATGGANVTSSSSSGHALGGGGAGQGGGQGGTASQGGGGGAIVCPPTKELGPGSDPPCVDETSDPQHCGSCSKKCLSTEACVHEVCQAPTAVDTDYAKQLMSANGDFQASGMSVSESASALAVGGVLAGTNPFNDGKPVAKPDPFVWLTQLSILPTDVGFEAVCHAKNDCGSVNSQQLPGDIVVNDAQGSQLVGNFGVASFDHLTLLGVDATCPGAGLGLSSDTGAELAIGDLSNVKLVSPSSSGGPATVHHGWPLTFVPSDAVKSPLRVVRPAGDVLFAGGVGHGSVTFGGFGVTVQAKREAFLALYENSGDRQWFRTFRGSSGGVAEVTGLATDGSNAYLVGTVQGSIDFESSFCGKLTAPAGSTRMFAASLDLSGSPESCNWATLFGSEDGVDTPVGIAPLQDGDVAIVGSTTATHASFGGQALAVPAPLFLLILDNGTGAHRYSWTWGNDSAMQATGQPVGVASTDDSDLWIAGWYTGGSMTGLPLAAPTDPNKHASYLIHFGAETLPD